MGRARSDLPQLSSYAILREVKTHLSGRCATSFGAGMTGDRGWGEHDDPQRLRAQHGVRPAECRRSRSSAPDAEAKHWRQASNEFLQSGHGKTGDRRLGGDALHDALSRVLRTTAADLEELSWVGTSGAVASGMQSVAFTPASAIAAVFAATGQGLGMVGTSRWLRHGTPGRRRLPGVDPFPGPRGRNGRRRHEPADGARMARSWVRGPDKVYRFAQIVAATALALEISASAAMATAGSENFFRAHFERGGLR